MKNKKLPIKKRKGLRESWKHQKLLFLLVVPVVVYYLLFHYLPFYGLQIAFKRYSPFVGMWKSKWVGFDNFKYLLFGPGKLMFHSLSCGINLGQWIPCFRLCCLTFSVFPFSYS